MGASVGTITASATMASTMCIGHNSYNSICLPIYLALLCCASGFYIGVLVEGIWSYFDKQDWSRKHIYGLSSMTLIGCIITNCSGALVAELIALCVAIGVFAVILVALYAYRLVELPKDYTFPSFRNWIGLNVLSGRFFHRSSNLDSILNKCYKKAGGS